MVFSYDFQIDLRRANNTEIMLTKVKMPLPDMMVSSKPTLVEYKYDHCSQLSLHQPGCSSGNG